MDNSPTTPQASADTPDGPEQLPIQLNNVPEDDMDAFLDAVDAARERLGTRCRTDAVIIKCRFSCKILTGELVGRLDTLKRRTWNVYKWYCVDDTIYIHGDAFAVDLWEAVPRWLKQRLAGQPTYNFYPDLDQNYARLSQDKKAFQADLRVSLNRDCELWPTNEPVLFLEIAVKKSFEDAIAKVRILRGALPYGQAHWALFHILELPHVTPAPRTSTDSDVQERVLAFFDGKRHPALWAQQAAASFGPYIFEGRTFFAGISEFTIVHCVRQNDDSYQEVVVQTCPPEDGAETDPAFVGGIRRLFNWVRLRGMEPAPWPDTKVDVDALWKQLRYDCLMTACDRLATWAGLSYDYYHGVQVPGQRWKWAVRVLN